MNDDGIKLACWGDHEVAKRVTDARKSLPCPFCGRKVNIVVCSPRSCNSHKSYVFAVECNKCNLLFGQFDTVEDLRTAWNTRAPILNAEENKT